jgi:hypothetical protein
MPKDGMWLCASWKPGTTVRPWKLTTRCASKVAAQLVAVADRDDAAAQDRERARARARGIHGEERAALEDSIYSHGVTRAAGDRPRR